MYWVYTNSNHAPPGQAYQFFNSNKTMDLRYSLQAEKAGRIFSMLPLLSPY